jgi:hypothetical protein
MTKREVLRYSALMLASLVAIGAIWYWFFVPYTLRIAVGPTTSEPARFFAALAKSLELEKAPLRLFVLSFPENQSSSVALDNNKADIAIVRTDAGLPPSGLAIAVAHRFIPILVARPGPDGTVPDLDKLTVGVFGHRLGNLKLFELLAPSYGLSQDSVRTERLSSVEEIGEAVRSGKVDALFIAAPRGSDILFEAINRFRAAAASPPVFVPISDSSRLIKRHPAFAADKIAGGEISAKPPLPEEETLTVTFPALIVARRTLSNAEVYEFTKQLFTLRSGLMGQQQAAARIEALPTDRDATFTVHPGASTYFDATETSLLENYSDVMWLALFGFSGVASLAAWLLSYAFPKRRELVQGEHSELIGLLEAARKAATFEDIEAIERRTDQLVADASQLIFSGSIDSDRQPAFDILLTRINQILERRRAELASRPPLPQ